jgi:hypothetical protein
LNAHHILEKIYYKEYSLNPSNCSPEGILGGGGNIVMLLIPLNPPSGFLTLKLRVP